MIEVNGNEVILHIDPDAPYVEYEFQIIGTGDNKRIMRLCVYTVRGFVILGSYEVLVDLDDTSDSDEDVLKTTPMTAKKTSGPLETPGGIVYGEVIRFDETGQSVTIQFPSLLEIITSDGSFYLVTLP